MKKLLLLAMLFFGTITFAQETFVRNYTYLILTNNDVSEEKKPAQLTVVFNPNNKKEVKFIYASGKVVEFYQTSSMKEGTTTGGYKYQLIDIVNKTNGVQITLQLFDDDDTMRLVFSSGDSIEFFN